MSYQFCAHTDPGLVRGNNEDSVTFDAALGLAVLADGMGGYNAGEVASAMATSFIRSELGRWLAEAGARASGRDVQRAMEICVDNSNRAILDAARANPQYAGMGTTLVAAVLQQDRLVVGHIGDSRCYRLRGGELTQLTRDHSLLQEQLDAGLLTAEEAAVCLHKNLVTRALGVEDAVLLDVAEHRTQPADLYLLCSDGLPDMLGDDAIAAILCSDESLPVLATRLVAGANAGGGRDNISVVLVRRSSGGNGARLGRVSRWLGI
ncbi:MAG: Stp1/IreP family PP2C-type Ser/Thr phosphatase [Proteobacteria bacterium]|nr:Stp1/IreP family PP2C-type Ser/Thr phosphatase [Pseudomonadota bacterium]